MRYRILIGWPDVNEGGVLQIGTGLSEDGGTIFLNFRVIPANFALDTIRLEVVPEEVG